MKFVLFIIALAMLASCAAKQPIKPSKHVIDCFQSPQPDPFDGGLGGTGATPPNLCPPPEFQSD